MIVSGLSAAIVLVTLAVVPPVQGGGAAALRAAAEYIAKEKVKGRVEVDPREIIAGVTGQAAGSEKLHSQATLSLLANPGVVMVASLDRARMCSNDPSFASCKSGGPNVYLALSPAAVTGRTATVEVLVSAARTLTGSDSVQLSGVKVVAERDALLRRLARPIATKYRLELSREATAWVVTKVILIGAS